MKKILLITLVVLLSGIGIWLYSNTTPTSDTNLSDINIVTNTENIEENEDTIKKKEKEKEECELSGGTRGIISRGQEPFCSIPLSDAGRPCNNSEECEGYCTLDMQDKDGNEVKIGDIVDGYCSKFVNSSCKFEVEGGVFSKGRCF